MLSGKDPEAGSREGRLDNGMGREARQESGCEHGGSHPAQGSRLDPIKRRTCGPMSYILIRGVKTWGQGLPRRETGAEGRMTGVFPNPGNTLAVKTQVLFL